MNWFADHATDQELRIDLSKVGYFDPAALLHLLAIISSRVGDGLSTRLELPKDREVRDFLRAWNFAPALESCAGISLHRLTDRSDHSRFGEQQEYFLPDLRTYPVESSPRILDDGLVRYLIGARFFGLVVHEVSDSSVASTLVEQECDRWRQDLVLRMLERHLLGPAEDFARVIVYELAANAVEHPCASKFVVVSNIAGSPAPAAENSFTFSVWDNGQGVVDTLIDCLSEGRDIRTSPPRRRDLFRIRPKGWKPSAITRASDETPRLGDASEEFLLASLFSGISRKEGKTAADKRIGDGLHALYRSVIDEFGGTLIIRTGFHVLRLSADTQRAGSVQYLAEIVAYPKAGGSFPGNMITARVPLRQ